MKTLIVAVLLAVSVPATAQPTDVRVSEVVVLYVDRGRGWQGVIIWTSLHWSTQESLDDCLDVVKQEKIPAKCVVEKRIVPDETKAHEPVRR